MATTDILLLARKLQSQLPVLAGDVPVLRKQLAAIICQAEQNPNDTSVENQIDALFLDYPTVYKWIQEEQRKSELTQLPEDLEDTGSRGGYKDLPGKPLGIPTLQYQCPVCGRRWSQMYKDELVPNCNLHDLPIALIPVDD